MDKLSGAPFGRMPFHQFAWGWLMFRILMFWPLSFYDKAPSYLHGWAGSYAHDERNYPRHHRSHR